MKQDLYGNSRTTNERCLDSKFFIEKIIAQTQMDEYFLNMFEILSFFRKNGILLPKLF